MDPFRSGGMGSMGMYGPQPHPGQLPRYSYLQLTIIVFMNELRLLVKMLVLEICH